MALPIMNSWTDWQDRPQSLYKQESNLLLLMLMLESDKPEFTTFTAGLTHTQDGHLSAITFDHFDALMSELNEPLISPLQLPCLVEECVIGPSAASSVLLWPPRKIMPFTGTEHLPNDVCSHQKLLARKEKDRQGNRM